MMVICGLMFTQAFASSYGRLYSGFSMLKLKGYNTETDKGAHLGYIAGVNIAQDRIPLYFQFGGEFAYVGYSSDKDYYGKRYRENILCGSVPLNISYKIGNGDITVEPFVGLNVRGNILGNLKYDGETYMDYMADYDARVFQLGMNVGLGINIRRFYMGYRFNPDFIDYLPDADSKTMYQHISIGVNF